MDKQISGKLEEKNQSQVATGTLARHIVVGATGALGSAIVKILTDQGQKVRAFVRNTEKARKVLPGEAELFQGDVLDKEMVRAACTDVEIVYNCVNVPYSKWESMMPTVVDNTIIAASAAGAVLVFPGNVYGYGEFRTQPISEEHPRYATGNKGMLRNQMEGRMMEWQQAGKLRHVICRLPDYFGPNVMNAHFGNMFRAALSGKTARWLGSLDQPHSLAFVMDAARACVLLAESPDCLAQEWHFAGAGPVTGREFVGEVVRQAGEGGKVGVMSEGYIRFGSYFSAEAREVLEILHQFTRPFVLDDSRFRTRFPDFRCTPHEEAIGETLRWFVAHWND